MYCSNCGAKLPVNEEKEVNVEINENKDTLEQEQSDNEKVVLQKEAYFIDNHGYLQKKEVGLTAKKIYIFLGVLAVIFIIVLIRNSSSQNLDQKTSSPEVSKTQTEQKDISEDLYKNGQDQFKQGKFKEAELTFKSLLDKYPSSNVSTDAKKCWIVVLLK